MNDTLREVLITDLPPAFVARFLESVEWAYRESWERVKHDTSINEEGRKQLLPHMRRVLIETKLKNISLDSGLRAEAEQVASGAHEYVAARAGRLVLTCSKTEGFNESPRSCAFRNQYADINEHIAQMNLFPVASTPGQESLYCIIAHGPKAGADGVMGFCCFGFINPETGKWAQEPIALADIRDYQQSRYQKADDDRADIQNAEPKLKPQFGVDDAEGNTA